MFLQASANNDGKGGWTVEKKVRTRVVYRKDAYYSGGNPGVTTLWFCVTSRETQFVMHVNVNINRGSCCLLIPNCISIYGLNLVVIIL